MILCDLFSFVSIYDYILSRFRFQHSSLVISMISLDSQNNSNIIARIFKISMQTKLLIIHITLDNLIKFLIYTTLQM